MVVITDEYGVKYYQLETLDATAAGLAKASKRLERKLKNRIRPRMVRRV